MACAKVMSAVSGFATEFGSQIRVRTLECDTPEGKAAAKKFGFLSHGLVIYDLRGELLFVRRDHMVSPDEVHAVLAKAVTEHPPASR